MGVTKSTLFSDQHNQMAAMAKALGHPARIAILEYLIKKGTCVCGDIVDELPLSQSTISQHLKAMKEAGIIQGEIDGTFRCYCIDSSKCAQFINQIRSMFRSITKCC